MDTSIEEKVDRIIDEIAAVRALVEANAADTKIILDSIPEMEVEEIEVDSEVSEGAL